MDTFEFCMERPASAGFGQLPSLKFHFDGNVLEKKPENLYVLGEQGKYKYFCLAIFKYNYSSNFFGAYQQRKLRLIYDTASLILHFGPEDCAHNAKKATPLY